jgi:hypothetical protein
MSAALTRPTSRVRPLLRDDLDEVANVYEVVARSGADIAPAHVAAYFARTFLDHPWADPELPSLVYVDRRGTISGFIGAHARRFRLDGSRLRTVCAGQLVTHPRVRIEGAGAFLMRELLAGKQDATFTDTANAASRRMWLALGGRSAELQSLTWLRFFRPWRFAGERALGRLGLARAAGVAAPVWSALDALTIRTRLLGPTATAGGASTVELSPPAIRAPLETLTDAYRLVPDYDDDFLDWVFRELAALPQQGRLVGAVVRRREQVVGWYAYYLRRGRISEVLQVAALAATIGDVLDALFRSAEAEGAAVLRGRVEPGMLDALAGRRCLLRYDGATLVHSRDPELARTFASADAFVTRLDGAWWMGHHLV